jgi:hypothetical protein
LVGNYQKLGHLEMGEFQMLSPLQGETDSGFDIATGASTPDRPEIPFEPEAIAFYQTASYMYRNRLYRELSPEEFDSLGTVRGPGASAVGGVFLR